VGVVMAAIGARLIGGGYADLSDLDDRAAGTTAGPGGTILHTGLPQQEGIDGVASVNRQLRAGYAVTAVGLGVVATGVLLLLQQPPAPVAISPAAGGALVTWTHAF
jgi:hypothetical protein